MILITAKNELLFDPTESDIIQTDTVEFVTFICGKCGEKLKCGEDCHQALKIFKEQLWYLDEEDYQTYCPDCADEIREEEGLTEKEGLSRDEDAEFKHLKEISGRKK